MPFGRSLRGQILAALGAGGVLAVLVVAGLHLLELPRAVQLRAGALAFVFGALVEWMRTSWRGVSFLFGLLVAAAAATAVWLQISQAVRQEGPARSAASREPPEVPGLGPERPSPGPRPTPDPHLSGAAAEPGAAAGRGAPPSASAAPGDTATRRRPGRLSDWLRASRLEIRYRYATYLPDACPEGAVALGNYGGDGWGAGIPARCEPDGWLSVDLAPLLASGRIQRGRTYCLLFRDRHGRAGQHVERQAPGLEGVRIAAAGRGGGRAIGFQVVRTLGVDRVVLTNEGHRWLPC